MIEKRFTNNFLSEDSEWRTRPTTSYSNYQKFVPSSLTWSKVNNDIYNNSDITFQTQLPYRYGESNRSALTDGWENTTISNEQYSKKSFAKKIVGINKSNTKGFFTNTYPYSYGQSIYLKHRNGGLLANQYYRNDGLIEGDIGVDRVDPQNHPAAEQWYRNARNDVHGRTWFNRIFWNANRLNIGSYNEDDDIENFVNELIIPRPQFNPSSSLDGNADTQYLSLIHI